MYFIDDYEKYELGCGASPATVNAYLADIDDFEKYICKPLEKVNADDVAGYLSKLADNGRSPATIGRRLASLRSFYDYIMNVRKAVKKNPCVGIKTPKKEESELVYLTEEEIGTLLDIPSDDPSGIRDKALLEFLYATGIRASEICSIKLSDFNMSIGYVSVVSKGKTRIVPFGKPCKAALREYIQKSRPVLLGKNIDDGFLFLNYLGKQITRQGIWKIVKFYGDKTEFSHKVSPQTIRNSFAAHLVQHGADLKSLQELLGHEDITATKIYLSVSKNRIMDVYDRAFPRA